LDEQDELIRSFQQIKSVNKPKPSYLNLSSSSSQKTKKVKQLEAFLVEDLPPVKPQAEPQIESNLSSPCSLYTPEEMSRTQDSGVESGAFLNTEEITSCSLLQDQTETSGVLEDSKQQNNCTTMASISDAESDREDLPLEEAKERKERLMMQADPLLSLDSLQSEKKHDEELLIDLSDSPVKKPTPATTSKMKTSKSSERIAKSLLDMQDLIFMPDSESAVCSGEKKDEPFCLITSIEQDYMELNSLSTGQKNGGSSIPQFATYDINRSSNRSSGNYFIDASSLLDETEIPSAEWNGGKDEKAICIAGVTTTCSEETPTPSAKNLVTFAAANMESPILITQVQRANEKRDLSEQELVLKNKLEVIARYKEEIKDAPPKVIEQKQGELIFKTSIPAYSKHVTGAEGKVSGNKLDIISYPSIEFTKVTSNAQDVQTPDSLNGNPEEVFESLNIKERTEKNKLDAVPVVSGGAHPEDFKQTTETPTSSPYFARKLDATAWVVDMSDTECVKKEPAKIPAKKTFLPTQLATVKLDEQEPEVIRRKNSGLGFFVDLSDSESTPQTTPRQLKETEKIEPVEEKKKASCFYIDIGGGKAKSEIPKKLAERRAFSREASREDDKKDDDSVLKRRPNASKGNSANRLSWHEAKPAEDPKKHKRTQSLCQDFKQDPLQKSESMSRIKSRSPDLSIDEDKSEKLTRSLEEPLPREKVAPNKSDLEPVAEANENKRSFVRLSDMDIRSTVKSENRHLGDGKSVSKKVEETSWIENKLMVRGGRSALRSKSPGKNVLMCHSPNQDTDDSEMSSMQSSVDRSGLGEFFSLL
jgi:hypothetical protein